MLLNRLKRELSIFQQLEPDTRKLILSNFCQNIANTLIFVFANAYMFISTNNMSSVAVFNLGLYITLLIAFYLNAFLSKFINIRYIFIPSLVIQGASLSILFLFQTLTLWNIFQIGLVSGFGFGFYWANRNFIYPALTKDSERDYISGLGGLVANASGVILPLIAGSLIVWAKTSPQLDVEEAYKLIMLFGILVLILGSFFLTKIKNFPIPKITSLRPKKISTDWKLFRIFILAASIQGAVSMTVIEVATLVFLGDEGVLGIIKSVLAIITGIAMYFIGRKMKPSDRFKILFFGILPLLTATSLLLLWFNQISLIIYLVAMSFSSSIFWFIYFPLYSKAVEIQDQGKMEDNYAYVIDHELFINIGRISATLFFLFAFHYWGNTKGLIIVTSLGAIAQLISLFISRRLIGLHNIYSANKINN